VGPGARERGRERAAGLVWVIAGLVLPGSAQWLALFFFFVLKLFLFFSFLFCCFDLFESKTVWFSLE
jgi:hypothetical protein